MKLICVECEQEQLVHSGHYWRYQQPRECTCGGILLPGESGLRQMKARNDSLLIPDNKGKVSNVARMLCSLSRSRTRVVADAMKESQNET